MFEEEIQAKPTTSPKVKLQGGAQMRVGLFPGGRGSRLCCKDRCFFFFLSVRLGVYFNRNGGYLISLI